MAPAPGDVLIRRAASTRFEVVEALTHRLVATCGTYGEAFAFAQQQPGSIWQQSTDNRGRPSADPVPVLHRIGRITRHPATSK